MGRGGGSASASQFARVVGLLVLVVVGTLPRNLVFDVRDVADLTAVTFRSILR